MPGPHQRGHERSLGRGFPAGPVIVRGPVKPAFALALYGGALTRLSRPLGARVTFSRACRPSQTAHLTLSPRDLPGGKASGLRWVVFHWRLPRPRRGGFTGSHLRYAPQPGGQRQAAVKLHGVLSPCGGLPACAPAPCIHGAPGQDSGDLVDPFMRAGTHPARHLATLRESELLPAFSGASPGCTPVSRTASGQDSAPVHTLSGLRGPMFLLNSQAPLGTATCGPRGVSPGTAGTPSPEVTGPICRVPWPGLSPRRLGLLTQGHLCRFSVRARGIVPGPLFMGPRSRRKRPYGRPFPPSAPSHHYGSPGPSAVSRVAPIRVPPVRLSGGVGDRACVAAPTPAAREY